MKDDFMPYKRLLEKNGHKFTKGKKVVLKTLLESNTHLAVKEMHQKANTKNLGLATVYRAVKVFCEIGIVKEINIQGINYYEMKMFSGKPLHIHFKCLKCGIINRY